jgi:hypothetical protein
MPDVLVQEVTTAMVAIRIAPEVLKKRDANIVAGVCLVCEKPLAKIPGDPKRGCCARCYQAVVRAGATKGPDEKRLIKDGRLLPVGDVTRGRPAIDPHVRSVIKGT